MWKSSDGLTWNQTSSSANWKARWGSGALTDGNRIWLIGGNNDQNMFYTKDGSNWKDINVSVPTNS